MQLKKGTEIEVKIDSLVFGGRGIGEHEGRKVFVDGVVPGDLAKVSLKKIKTNYAEANLLEILEEGPSRIKAKCKHFDTCGGCKWQFIPYEEQCKVKEQQVRDSIERLGGLPGDLVQPIIPNSDPWNYRNKMELSFGIDAEGMAMLGFYPPGYHYEVFNLEECFLQSPLIAETVKKVRDFANEYNVPVFNKDTHEGLLRNLIIREGINTGEIMIILVTSPGEFGRIDEFTDLFDESVTSIYWNKIYQMKGRRTRIEEELLRGKPELLEVLHLENGHSLEFGILPQAFFQTNTKQAEVLYSKVLELADLNGDEVVFDLYCGTGTIGLFCAHKAKKVIGIEQNPAAVESAIINAKQNKIENAEYILGSVDAQLKGLDHKPDVVIVDPPRSGLGDKVVGQCVEFGASRIVYVSCNPTTLARDLKKFLELGYSTKSITPVDMFPQTSHVESVVLLHKGTDISP